MLLPLRTPHSTTAHEIADSLTNQLFIKSAIKVGRRQKKMAETTGKGYQPKKRTRIPDKDGDNDDGPITIEGEMPKKTFYRSRAHVNPLSHNNAFAYPVAPSQHDWAPYYPTSNGTPTIVDVGCGFGGLTVALAELYPEECSLGMEIRAKVALFNFYKSDTYTITIDLIYYI
jgi:hypothetical protein